MQYIIFLLVCSGFLLAGETTATYKVEGMMCNKNCPMKVRQSLEGVDGVKVCQVDFESDMATVTFDDEKIFVGTMNLDPRSLDLNTEMGVLIDSEKLSGFLAHWVDKKMPEYAWKVELKSPDDDELIWLDTISNQQFDEEPQTSSWRRFQVWFISLFPIEDEL